MSAIRLFFLGFAAIAGLILYVAAAVLPEPPLWASLFAREPVTVVASDVQTRNAKWPALPVIDVRDASGTESMLLGYRWMSTADAAAIIASARPGEVIDIPRHDGKLWRGLSGMWDWILLIVSMIAAVGMLFGLRMVWKLRRS